MSEKVPSLYTLAQVAANKTDNSCWMVIRNKVYDVHAFLEEHPGGSALLTDVAGQDATEGFDDIGHSEDAIAMLEKYLIGDLIVEKKEAAKQGIIAPTVALSLLIIVIAVAYYAYARHMETKHAINPLGTKAPN